MTKTARARRRDRMPTDRHRAHEVTTPEGVPLPLTIARAGDRMGAFFIDFFIQALLILAFFILALMAARGSDADWVGAFAHLLFFSIRTFYFVWFEIRWQGRTPGKRKIGIRVMDAQGGPLTGDAVVVRNLMRELELWLPMSFLFAPDQIWPDAPGWARLASSVWVFAFALMPLFNRRRLRIGDMVAGTQVVVAPETVLLQDIGGQEVKRREKKKTSPETSTFTDSQLDVYGIYELQVLEDLLRQDATRRSREAMEAVARKIRKKIEWKGPTDKPDAFLRQFYAELRARLEKKMLLGKRKKDKFSRE